MNKELFAILKKGEIETDEDFNIFYKYSDDVITDTYSFEELTDVRIYIWEEKGIFCEIYADIDKDTWADEDKICNIESPQYIRFFVNGEDCHSFNDVQRYLKRHKRGLSTIKN